MQASTGLSTTAIWSAHNVEPAESPLLGTPTGLTNCSMCRWSMPVDPSPLLVLLATALVVVAQTVAQSPQVSWLTAVGLFTPADYVRFDCILDEPFVAKRFVLLKRCLSGVHSHCVFD